MKPKIQLVFGRICSGKSSYRAGESMPRVVVSDIVRGIVNRLATREDLQNTMHLDNIIAETLLTTIDVYDSAYGLEIIVDGIRQVSIVEKVLEKYPDAELVWLEVPTEERRRRYYARQDAKDVESFEVADSKQIELEGQKIFDIFRDKMTITNNYGIN